MREELKKMGQRHGIEDNPRALAEFGAKILSRSLAVSKKLLEIDQEQEFLPRFSLKQGFRDVIGIGGDPLFTTDVAKKIEEAISYNTNCEREQFIPSSEDVIGYFRVPPREHCLSILDVELPYADFVEVPKSEPPPQKVTKDELQQWMDGHIKTPGLFKITCRSFDSRFSTLINFGDSATNTFYGNAGSYKRQWISTPEICFLSNFAEITIHQALFSQSTYATSNFDVLMQWDKDIVGMISRMEPGSGT